MSQSIVREYPGGWRVLYGGTRTGVRLARPWQVVAPFDPSKCAFCKGEGKEVGEFANSWKLLENRFTPSNFHQMVIPPSCWEDAKLRVLGGSQEAAAAFENIGSVIADNREWPNIQVTAYIGWLAGQNIPHLHYHIINALHCDRDREDVLADFMRRSERVLSEEGSIKVVVESIEWAGQCFIVPDPAKYEDMEMELGDLGVVMSRLAVLYAKAFVSSDKGLSPDFQLFFSFREGRLVYGSYLPILNHLGSTDTVGAHHSGTPIYHPWMPEETLEYLQKFL